MLIWSGFSYIGASIRPLERALCGCQINIDGWLSAERGILFLRAIFGDLYVQGGIGFQSVCNCCGCWVGWSVYRCVKNG